MVNVKLLVLLWISPAGKLLRAVLTADDKELGFIL